MNKLYESFNYTAMRIRNLEKTLTEFAVEQYGENAWIAIDGAAMNILEDNIYLTIDMRGGIDADENMFDMKVDIPAEIDNVEDYLKGFIVAKIY